MEKKSIRELMERIKFVEDDGEEEIFAEIDDTCPRRKKEVMALQKDEPTANLGECNVYKLKKPLIKFKTDSFRGFYLQEHKGEKLIEKFGKAYVCAKKFCTTHNVAFDFTDEDSFQFEVKESEIK